MRRAGVVGIGDMGGGLAANLIQAGFETFGFDLKPERLAAFAEAGGVACADAAEVGARADAVFVMVLNGREAKEAILGEAGIARGLAPGGTILLTATILPREAREIEAALAGTGISLIDSPVSGGRPGAAAGTLTMMAAGAAETLAANRDVMEAVGGDIHHVDTRIGMGQTLKACLQGLMGSIFAATFEAAALAEKSGLDMAKFAEVLGDSAASNRLSNGSMEKILARAFEGQGSTIATMWKDLTCTTDHARDMGAPIFMAATAMQLFQAGITRHPGEENETVAKIYEEILGVRIGGRGAS